MTLKEALNNEEIAKKFESATSMEEILSVLKEKGVETTEEELLATIGSEIGDQEEGELSDESLEGVAGGLVLPNLWSLGAKAILKLLKSGVLRTPLIPPIIRRRLGL